MSKKKHKPLTREIPERTDEAIDKVFRRLERLQKLITLNAPRVFIDQECRMISYGALLVASALDDDENEEAEIERKRKEEEEQKKSKASPTGLN